MSDYFSIILWQLISNYLPRHITKFVWKLGTTSWSSQLYCKLGNQLWTSRCSCQLRCNWTSQVCSTVTSFPVVLITELLSKKCLFQGSQLNILNSKYSSSFSWAFSVKHYYIISSPLELLLTFCMSHPNQVSLHNLSNLCASITY